MRYNMPVFSNEYSEVDSMFFNRLSAVVIKVGHVGLLYDRAWHASSVGVACRSYCSRREKKSRKRPSISAQLSYSRSSVFNAPVSSSRENIERQQRHGVLGCLAHDFGCEEEWLLIAIERSVVLLHHSVLFATSLEGATR
jgi:hypothetical protein